MILGNWQKLCSAIGPSCLEFKNSLATWQPQIRNSALGSFSPLFFPNPIAKVGRRGPGQAVSALVPLRKGCAQGSAELKNCWVTRLFHTTDRRLLSLSAELSSSFLALSPVLSPSGRLSAELLFSFLAHSPSPTTTTATTTLRTGQLRVLSPTPPFP